jgi:hypothetical protein
MISASRKFPRFVKQKDNCSCGPVVLLNAHKYLEDGWTYKDLKKIKSRLKWGPQNKEANHKTGTSDRILTYYITRFLFPYLRDLYTKETPSQIFKKITKHLKKDRIVILSHPTEKEFWHYSLLIPPVTKTKIATINFQDTHNMITKQRLKKLLKKGKQGMSIWILDDSLSGE